MKQTNKSRVLTRRLYSPGLYSLVFLPLLCIGYLAQQGMFKQYSVLEVILWDPQLHFDHPNLFHYEFHPDIEFVEFKLTGNKEQDKLTLQQAEQEIIELKNTRNTSKGVHFHFEEKAKYWSWIRANDMCNFGKTGLINNVYDNEIWVFNIQPKITEESDSKENENSNLEKDTRLLCGTCSGMICGISDDFNKKDKLLAEQKLKRELIIERVKLLAIPGVFFLMLLFFSFKKVRDGLK